MKGISRKTSSNILIAIIALSILYFSNLYWLSLVDKPALRGNHVGLSFLSMFIFLGLVILLKMAFKSKK